MHARVLSSSARAPAASRGGGLVKQPSSPPLRRPLTAPTTTRKTTTTTTTATRASSSDPGESNAAAANVVAANPLFAGNPAFAAVLSNSLSRQGSEALVSGEARNPEEEEFGREGPIEEVLASCLRDQRQAVVQLESLTEVVKASLEREKKQFQRLQFAFKKAGNDRAYAQSLAKLRKRDKEEMIALKEELKKLRG